MVYIFYLINDQNNRKKSYESKEKKRRTTFRYRIHKKELIYLEVLYRLNFL